MPHRFLRSTRRTLHFERQDPSLGAAGRPRRGLRSHLAPRCELARSARRITSPRATGPLHPNLQYHPPAGSMSSCSCPRFRLLDRCGLGGMSMGVVACQQHHDAQRRVAARVTFHALPVRTHLRQARLHQPLTSNLGPINNKLRRQALVPQRHQTLTPDFALSNIKLWRWP